MNASNTDIDVFFQYGTNPGYGSSIAAAQSPVSGSGNTAVTASIAGLSPGITYHFRVVAQSASDTVYGNDITFTTAMSFLPSADTLAAAAVGTDAATLNGTVNANNAGATVTFQYGLTTAYGASVTADQSPVGGIADTAVTASPAGLLSGTTYHFRVVATNANGTAYGARQDLHHGRGASPLGRQPWRPRPWGPTPPP